MSLFDYTWNLHQSGEIDKLDERVDALEKNMETAKAWIEYLEGELKKIQLTAGADKMSGDGSYQIGTKEGYDAFVEKRNANRRDS
jgi:predicted RNase H-like nuclease (RuvC/YqgF family)